MDKKIFNTGVKIYKVQSFLLRTYLIIKQLKIIKDKFNSYLQNMWPYMKIFQYFIGKNVNKKIRGKENQFYLCVKTL